MFGRNTKRKPRHDAITAFLGAGTQYHGQFRFQGVVRIDGGVIGDIISDGVLVLGEEGQVEGSISVGELIASGSVRGDVTASRRVILNKTAKLTGNIQAAFGGDFGTFFRNQRDHVRLDPQRDGDNVVGCGHLKIQRDLNGFA